MCFLDLTYDRERVTGGCVAHPRVCVEHHESEYASADGGRVDFDARTADDASFPKFPHALVSRAGGEADGLAQGHDGKRLNSPNDIVVRADGTIWFTDPSYGIDGDYEGNKGDNEFGSACYVFRLEPATGELRVVANDFCRPNGLAFSPDEQQLYIVDTRQEPSHIRIFDVTADGNLAGGRVFAECDNGRFDGLRVDDAGRVWAAAWDGVHCFDPDGTLIGKLLLPESVANLTFGGPKRNHLYITAGRSLYTLRVTFNGAGYPRSADSAGR
jgi:gluconolactonase